MNTVLVSVFKYTSGPIYVYYIYTHANLVYTNICIIYIYVYVHMHDMIMFDWIDSRLKKTCILRYMS